MAKKGTATRHRTPSAHPAAVRTNGKGGKGHPTPRATARRRARRSAWRGWGWVIGLVAAAAVIGVVIQSSRSGSGPVVTPRHEVGAGGAEIMGQASAPVLVEEFGDFQCPACGAWDSNVFPTVERLVQEGKIRFAYYPFAFLGAESTTAASAAVCAGDEGSFWEFRAALYAHQFPENSGALTAAYLTDLGHGLGIDSSRFDSCVSDGTYRGWIGKVADQTTARGVTSTPTILVDGKGFSRPPSAEELTTAVEAASR